MNLQELGFFVHAVLITAVQLHEYLKIHQDSLAEATSRVLQVP